MNEIKAKLSKAILTKFLIGESEEMLTDDFNLIESGVLNSMAVISLVSFIENEFQFDMEVKDLVMENFHSINRMAALVEERLAGQAQ